MSRINGKSFDVRLMGFKVHVESFNLSIEDNTTTAKNGGIPNGVLEGDVAASGEIVVDTANFNLILAAAKAAGSFRDLPPFTIDAYAQGTNDSGIEVMSVRAYGCKLKVGELLSVDPTSSDKTTHTLAYDVTSSDFVWINGVPYLRESEFSLI
ncbi:DUF2597 family protein [Oceanospirillaceae bacterium ASx5O]|nr:DUF2597 family protein [Oceanospirillaceae bacterium ASx5O]